jgi:hypothetical protein
MIPADPDHRLDAVGRAQRAGQGGRHPQGQDGQRLGDTLAQRGGGAGVSFVQLGGEPGQQSLGLQGRCRVVSLAYPPPGHLPEPAGQLVDHVPDLVFLASLDDWLVEYGPDRRGQGFRPVGRNIGRGLALGAHGSGGRIYDLAFSCR